MILRCPNSMTRDLEEEDSEESKVEGAGAWLRISAYPGRKLLGVGPLTRNAVEIESTLCGPGLSRKASGRRLDLRPVPSRRVATLTSFPSLISQTSGGKHFTKGTRLDRLRQTSVRAGSSRDLEQLASETADALASSKTRCAAIDLTISSSPQHLCTM